MKKTLLIALSIIILTVSIFVGCSNNKVAEPSDATTTISASDTTTQPTSSVTSSTTTTTTKKADETTTKATTKATSSKAAPKSTTKAVPKSTAKQTTKATTKKQSTTKKVTTTKKPTTTKKNVTPQEVQAQVNAYIKSKGITLDSSLNTGNAGYSYGIGGNQNFLNDGSSLRNCKECVDAEIADWGKNLNMYCYYSNSDKAFYICYMLF